MMIGDKEQPLRDALFDLQCISEIMEELGRNVTRDDGVLHATWMEWMGGRVFDATRRANLALDAGGRDRKPAK